MPAATLTACGDRTPASHDANLAGLAAKYAGLSTVAGVIARFG